jgi:hypothetical protein
VVDALDLYKLTLAVTELDLTYKVISSQRSRLTGWVMTWGKIPKGAKVPKSPVNKGLSPIDNASTQNKRVCAKLTSAIHDIALPRGEASSPALKSRGKTTPGCCSFSHSVKVVP